MQSTMQDFFPAIDAYALLSDTHTGALLAPDGTVEWMCAPTFDAGSIFACMLDRTRGGRWQLEVVGGGLQHRRYLEDSLVLESRYTTPDGVATVHDFLAVRDDPAASEGDPPSAEHVLVRTVHAEGTPRVRVRVDARPDYGRQEARWRTDDSGCWINSEPRMWLSATLPLQQSGSVLESDVSLADGESFVLALGYADAAVRRVEPAEAEQLLQQTRQMWQQWSARTNYDGVARDHVRRSALVLRALAFDDSGGLLAAPTTSLPEQVGGERNWDYRYTWYRDAGMLLLSMFQLGHGAGGARYLQFLLHSCAADPHRPPPMVAIDGTHDRPEVELDNLRGYRDSQPVRVGNEGFTQIQLDTYGHLLDAAHAYQQLTGALREDEWSQLREYVEQATNRWRETDHGLWEIRGPTRHYVNSKVMLWVCLDRGIRLAETLGDDDAPTQRWREVADQIHRDVLERGYDQQQGAFVLAYGETALDASLLRIPLVGFLPGDDPRMISTIDRIIEQLGVPGTPLLYRYNQTQVDDGLAGEEGAFLLCSFELVSALVLAGRHQQAREAFDWLCARAGPLGLFSEQMDPDGTALGNFPQALSHLGLIQAAVNVNTAGKTEALHAWATDRAGPRASMSQPTPGRSG